MDAKEILKSALRFIAPAAIPILLLVIFSVADCKTIDESKKLADATLGEVGALLIAHALVLASLVRK